MYMKVAFMPPFLKFNSPQIIKYDLDFGHSYFTYMHMLVVYICIYICLVVSSNKTNKKISISMDNTTSHLDIQLPPGFRFHPTDEELIVHYLQKKVTSTTLPAPIFAEIELYKYDPWELPYKALFGEDEWYFFTPRDRKYPNGVRPNRMAGSGYWKATGTDRPILGLCNENIVGVKKALVFYKGRPPRGDKTDWIIHEYRLLESVACSSSKSKESMRLDDWVLCRVRQKTCTSRNLHQDRYGQRVPEPEKSTVIPTDINSNLDILKRESLFKDCPMLPFIFDSHLDFSSIDTMSSSVSFSDSKNSFEGPYNDNRKRKETSQYEGFIECNKKFKATRDQNDESGSLTVDTNEMSLYNCIDSEMGIAYQTYMMAYQDLNHLTFM
ncbi:putative transcription factor NAM family [Helianthus annuus]|nr:putative transcription factor NAM family [Helianthus annuus]KAJ0663451.1 putative transcription factor NAM family [Helianthus annuus]KAJ0670946.1 putative transcription factor NAM family [Helianthus annuus]KAJ0857887.1 putative transcription factor NAM family [Helianthus annuus]